MKLIVTDEALDSLEDLIDFLLHKQKSSIKNVPLFKYEMFERINQLLVYPKLGQYEPYLEGIQLKHRRIIYNNVKIIYLITEDAIYVTDIFDTRQNPNKMKG